MTIAEWEAACQHTMDHGMFYKVPLPAVFLGYVETQRQTIAEAQRLETQRLADRQAYGFNAPAVSVPGKDRAWARLHVAMIEAGIPRPGHYDEAVEYCERCVTLDPDNAADWQAEADWWRQGAHGRPVLPSMHRIIVHGEDIADDVGNTCMCSWSEDRPCPNRAVWRLENTTNDGYSLMCTPHKEGFARFYPNALVRYRCLLDDPYA